MSNSSVIWKNLISPKIEFDPHLDLLSFFPSVKVRETLLNWQFFIKKNLVTSVLNKY